MKKFLRLVVATCFLGPWTVAFSDQGFVVEDVRIEGINQVSTQAVFDFLPIERGDTVDDAKVAQAIRSLFGTGYFDDVAVFRDQSQLVVKVLERPAIAIIRLEGNKAIKDEALRQGLEHAGLKEGDIFKRSVLDQINQDLVKLYAAQGRYGAKVETSVEPLPNNRVAVNITVDEGKVSSISHINIIGNKVFDDETLLDQFDLGLPSFWAFFSDRDKYAREKLNADLERLRDYYMDRGYIDFNVDSTQVSLGPINKDVYITVNITEGERYAVREIKVLGELNDLDDELNQAVTAQAGDIFSRKVMTSDRSAITDVLGNHGYLFANVSAQPEVHDDQTVTLRYLVASGKKSYVRRINIQGNTRTGDEIVRREMRQMEAAPASREKIQLSKQRLDRIGYFGTVQVETVPVEGADDQVDLNFNVTEQQSGSFSATVGYAQGSGMMLGLSVKQDNFLGTGKEVKFAVTDSDSTREYSFSENDPYYTVDGVSRGYKVYFREQDFDEDDVSSYQTDEIGAGVNFGYPIDEYQRLTFGTNLEGVQIKTAAQTPQEIVDFINVEGDQYLNIVAEGTWSDNHLNRGFFPTDGYSNTISAEVALPGSDLTYFRLNYTGKRYIPLDDNDRWVLGGWGRLGYAAAYGENDYPFYRNFYAGGLRSVRGYASNSLGPKDTPQSGYDAEPFGGDLLVTGGLELVLPFDITGESGKTRTILFLDGGNVFNSEDDVNPDDVRFSTGIGLSWLTPIGPLSFVLAKALNADEDDETQSFQFSIGQTF